MRFWRRSGSDRLTTKENDDFNVCRDPRICRVSSRRSVGIVVGVESEVACGRPCPCLAFRFFNNRISRFAAASTGKRATTTCPSAESSCQQIDLLGIAQLVGASALSRLDCLRLAETSWNRTNKKWRDAEQSSRGVSRAKLKGKNPITIGLFEYVLWFF
jgi:hypothetical protein